MVGGVAFLRHRITKVGDPWQPCESMNQASDAKRCRDWVRRPDDIRMNLPDQSKATRNR
jgi:hypothetical protein